MSNKTIITSLYITLLLLFTTACQSLKQIDVAKQKQVKPNIVWLISEDNSPNYLRLYDELGAEMPNVEAMAKHGITFNNAFSNAPVCSTARSTLALGVYPPKAGTMHHRAFAKANHQKDLKSIYRLMKAFGYFVTNDKKTDFNFNQDDKSEFDISELGADWKKRQKGQAFFHVQTFMETHEKNLMFPLSDVSGQATTHDPNKVKLAAIHPDTELFRYTHARYLDNHQKLDLEIGKVLTELEAEQELENTFVFYFGDHGGVLPGSKSFAKESGLKVPLVVRIPKNFRHLLGEGFGPNKRVDGFVNFVDFAPTLLNLIGQKPLADYDGKAFLGQGINLEDVNNREISFGYADRFGEKYDLIRTVRKGNLKYVRNFIPLNPLGLYQDYRFKNQAYKQLKHMYLNGQLNQNQAALFQAKPAEALYDLSQDPEELNNLAQLPKYKADVAALRHMLFSQLKTLPDLGFISESVINQNLSLDSFDFAAKHAAEIHNSIDILNLQLSDFAQARDALNAAISKGSEQEKYWALVTLTHFSAQAVEFAPMVNVLLAKADNSLVKARAIEFLSSINQIEPVTALTQLIHETSDQMAVLEIMNIAAVMHDTQGLIFNIKLHKNWQQLPAKNSPFYSSKAMLNHSTKVRIKYLKTPR